ncbi:MarR family transcriptional regulator [Paenibacillus sp. GP183]|uniref:MarR family winged helix-turn-helix transcriptional regulator n=1 Tax=Paenibacillus sp. GP183 TaxID=1882751 RepID=UPI00089AA707|nr:MarR family transcriptional regulator [Paenibacillus sp. GP183]SEB97666.1 DNA-binding transcriptional regulator, MarR family [Paenibacillus sp. GP183]
MRALHLEAERFRYYILAAQRLGQRQLNDFMKTIELTVSQSEVIRVLEQWQPISLKDLGSLLICETGSPSRLIERMVEDGLVDKVANPSDARFVWLQLTEKGMGKAKQIMEFEEKLYKDLESILSNDEMTSVSSTLEKMLSHFPIIDTLRKRNLL